VFGIHNYWLFIVSGILLNIVPGQDTVYILGRSISQGRRAGILSALGVSAGCLVHTCAAAAFGLSALLAASSRAFVVVKLAGAIYLVYLGVRMLLSGATAHEERPGGGPASAWTIFRQGVLTNVLNPKVALFFLAFLPQFIDPASTTRVTAFLLLGMTFIFNGTIWCMCLVWFASVFSRRLRGKQRFESWLKRTAGALFVGLGLRIAFEKA
jgi:threonine/homoserine/homoserine lactone efflux protein